MEEGNGNNILPLECSIGMSPEPVETKYYLACFHFMRAPWTEGPQPHLPIYLHHLAFHRHPLFSPLILHLLSPTF